MWLLSTWNGVSVTKELNLLFPFQVNELESPHMASGSHTGQHSSRPTSFFQKHNSAACGSTSKQSFPPVNMRMVFRNAWSQHFFFLIFYTNYHMTLQVYTDFWCQPHIWWKKVSVFYILYHFSFQRLFISCGIKIKNYFKLAYCWV